MRKWMRILAIVGGSLLGLIVLLWLGFALIIQQQKASLLAQINTKINEELNATVVIEDMEPSLVRSFPNISVSLEKVSVKDSLWSVHHRALLEVDRIFVKVNTFALLKKKIDIRQITLEDGTIYIYTDTSGYSNTDIIRSHEHKNKQQTGHTDVSKFELNNIQFVVENKPKHKFFQFDIQHLEGNTEERDTMLDIRLKHDILIKEMQFNTEKGSFLKDKLLAGKLLLHFNKKQRALVIPHQDIRLNKQIYSIDGQFSMAKENRQWGLNIVANELRFEEAMSIVSPSISKKLDSLSFKKPLDIKAQLVGIMHYPDTPLINIQYQTQNNEIEVKGNTLTNCSFTGTFNNDLQHGKGHNDENTQLQIHGFKADYATIPLVADTLIVTNLKHPVLQGWFRSFFPLSNLNELLEGTFAFTSGEAKAQLYYKGGIKRGDTIVPHLSGTVAIQKGALTYLPRNVQFHDCFATLDFTGTDLYFKEVKVASQKSQLQLDGSVANITNLYFHDPAKILLNWNIRSPKLDLNEFRSFIGIRSGSKKPVSTKQKRKNMSKFAHQMDIMLADCSVAMNVAVDQLLYERFTAQQVRSALTLTQTGLHVQQLQVQHAGGSLQATADMDFAGQANAFKVNANINNVHIDQLFYAFNNFGLDGLSSKNLRGILQAKANVSGRVLDDGKIVPRSLYGTVAFNLRKGALVNFPPLQGIADLMFAKRNLDNIQFENLQNTLQIKGNKIDIPPMKISSTAINIDLQGTYGMPAGTDIYMDVPLRNPQKDADITDKAEKAKRRQKGIVLHLHATDNGKSGPVKIKLGKKRDG
ncbi:AsmA-like protein [Chitinophaga skermanii]|uniref:AsmA-like protein n=1 Tax=Chitinophaga skermanii TaxID=331697 RepID=A0A327QPF5_9BACT|nr:AsmA family protein [Chitinophaga skermanii]RAJ05532.1 AsmA-like protein [Chitinophaga skermanii]